MCVIVDDRRASDLANLGEAPSYPAEIGKAAANHCIGTAHFDRHRDRGERILDVVPPGHREADSLDPAILFPALTDDHIEAIAAGIGAHVDAADVGLKRESVGDHPAVADLADHRLHFGVIDAQDRRAIEGDVVDELDEGVLDPVEIAVMIEMFGVDIGDHRDGPVEPQEAAVALVGLDHHPVAVAQPRIRAILLDDPAVDHGGIDPAAVEQRGDHAGCGGLAMGARDRDGGFEPHQLGEHLRAADHRDAVLERVFDFGVGPLDRTRGDHHGDALDVLRRMADRHRDAARAQPLDRGAFPEIGALHLVAEVGHHLGDARHADPADADEMDRSDLGVDALHSPCSRAAPCPAGTPCEAPRALLAPTRMTSIMSAPPKPSTRSARSLTASGRPQFHAPWAAFARPSGLSASAMICLASSLAPKRSWRIIRAPPAWVISRVLAAW